MEWAMKRILQTEAGSSCLLLMLCKASEAGEDSEVSQTIRKIVR
jgi:hypothetical protein